MTVMKDGFLKACIIPLVNKHISNYLLLLLKLILRMTTKTYFITQNYRILGLKARNCFYNTFFKMFKNRLLFYFLKKDFIYLLLERGKERERNTSVGEIHQLVASCMPPTGDLA